MAMDEKTAVVVLHEADDVDDAAAQAAALLSQHWPRSHGARYDADRRSLLGVIITLSCLAHALRSSCSLSVKSACLSLTFVLFFFFVSMCRFDLFVSLLT